MTQQPQHPDRYARSQPSRYFPTSAEERNYRQLRVRQDTDKNWRDADPVLAAGEFAYTIAPANALQPPLPDQCIKVGDGNAHWSQLPYLGGRGPKGPQGDTGDGVRIVGVLGDCGPPTADEAPNPEKGDMWVVSCVDREDTTADSCMVNCDGLAYVWDGSAWQSIGSIQGPPGNNVDYFYEDFTATEGQTEFDLSRSVQIEASFVTINGVVIAPIPDNYTLELEKLTLTSDVAVKAGDVVGIFSFIGAVNAIVAGLTTADIGTVGTRPNEVKKILRQDIKNQQEANWYLLDAVDNLEIPEDQDLSTYATIDAMQAGDADTLAAANTFTTDAIAAIPPVDLSGYVRNEGGDSMQGPLAVRPQGGNARETSKIQTLGVFSNSEGSALRLGTTRDRVYIGHNDVSINGPLKIDEIQEKNAGDGIELTDRVILKTEGVSPDEVVTKKYIDDKTRHLQDEIVELEEEIDAIAPSVERGKWSFTAVGTVAQPSQFTMYDADFGNGSPTGLFKSAKSIWFNELDLDGTPHSFANVKDGELLEIFIDGSPDYGLFSVTGESHDETQSGIKFWVVDVDFVRTNETTTAVSPGETCRFKIFEAPSGGEATSFVMKTGDTMSGKLELDKPHGDSDNGAGFTVKGAIVDNYSSTTVSEQAGDLLQAYHNTGAPDAINYRGKITSDKNIATKEYVDSKVQSSSNSPVMLHSGSGYAYKFVDKGILSSSQFSSDSHQASESYLYISRLWGQKRGWTQVVNYDRTEDTIIEVWQINSDGSTLLIIRAGINSIEQAEWTQHDAKLTLNRFWSKPGYSFSKFNDYTFMIHGLVERAELISPLGYSRGDEVKMQPTVQKNGEVS